MATSKCSREDRREAARRRRLRRERSRRFISGLAVAVAVTGIIVLAVMLLVDRDSTGNGDDAAPANVEPDENFDTAAFVNGPRIAVDQTAVEHGDVPYGYEASASYQLKNVGDQVLRIENPEVKILDGC